MKVKLLISRCGPDVNDNAGDVIDVDTGEGKRLIESGQAVAHKVTERATKKGKVENASVS